MLVEKIFASKIKINDSRRKSLMKAVSWRILGTLDTIVIAWVLTGKFSVAFSIGSVEIFSKFFLYYGHERIWNHIK